MNKKILIGIIAVLAAALLVQTGYLIGKGKSERTQPQERLELAQQPGPRPSTWQQQAMSRQAPTAGYARGDMQAEAWDPFEEMNRLQRVMNRMFNDSYGRASQSDSSLFGAFGAKFDPAIDVREQKDTYVVIVDLPGVNKDSISISAQPHSVTISGERSIEMTEQDESSGLYRAERSFGSFQRTIPFMERIVPDKVTAETTEGVLLITLPKEQKTEETADKGVAVNVQ